MLVNSFSSKYFKVYLRVYFCVWIFCIHELSFYFCSSSCSSLLVNPLPSLGPFVGLVVAF